MKKKLTISFICSAVLAIPVFADDAKILQKRLNQVNSFYSSVTQRILTAEGQEIQKSTGELWIKKQNLFNWHMFEPDENILISDGKTVWFYDCFTEQATANWLKNITINTPFMLITNNSSTYWRQYNIKKEGDNFLLFPKSSNNNFKKFTIIVTSNGIIKSFSAIEQDNQCSTYELKNQKNIEIKNNKFYFTTPKGATLDDQR